MTQLSAPDAPPASPHTCVLPRAWAHLPVPCLSLQRKGVVGQAGDWQGRRLLDPIARASPERKVLWGLPVPCLSPQHLWSHARALRLWRASKGVGLTYPLSASHARDRAGKFAQSLRLDEDGNQPIGSLLPVLMRTAISPSDRCCQF